MVDRIPWHHAIHRGFSHLLNGEYNVLTTDLKGRTLLHYCVEIQKLYCKVIRRLIELKADINARDNEQRTPLIIAIQKHNKKLIEKLLKHGADPRIPYGDITALHLTASRCKAPEIFCLFEKYGFLDYHPTVSGWTIIHAAAQLPNLPVLEFFQSRNFDLNVCDNSGHNAVYELFKTNCTPEILVYSQELFYLVKHRQFNVPDELYPFIRKKTLTYKMLKKHYFTWLRELYAHKDSFSGSSIKWIQDVTFHCCVMDSSLNCQFIAQFLYFPCKTVHGDLHLSVFNWLLIISVIQKNLLVESLTEFSRVAFKTGLFQKLFQVYLVKQDKDDNHTYNFALQLRFALSVKATSQKLSSHTAEAKQLGTAMNEFVREYFLCHYSHSCPYARRAALFAIFEKITNSFADYKSEVRLVII
jgi:hypothetical protein